MRHGNPGGSSRTTWRLGAAAALAGALSVCAAAPPAVAQDVPFDIAPTADCLAASETAEARRACTGRAARACMETDDGSTTVGMGACLDRELAFWDARLNEAYGRLMEAEKREDAEMAEIGATVPEQAPALRQMQRAWIAWRDATCDYERAQWGGGTGGGPATYQCLLRLTGEQALYLEDIFANWSN